MQHQQQPFPAAVAGDDNDDDDNPRKRRRRRRHGRGARRGNSLLALLDALVGKRLLFELRDDAVVSGRLAEVDDRGAFVVVEDATWRPPPCREMVAGVAAATPAAPKLPSVHIRGRALRFVHLPGSLDPGAAIEAHRATVVAQRVAAARELLARRHGRMAKGDGGVGYEDEEEGEEDDGGGGLGGGGDRGGFGSG